MSAERGPRVHGHLARKRFGQHFLVDHRVLDGILLAVSPRDDQRLVEIGPGLGALTDVLLERIGRLTAIEIDRDLAQRLRERYPAQRLNLIEGDALRTDWRALAGGDQLRLVGNLPYNVATPLMTGLIPVRERILDAHFMIQREVAERLCAREGGAAYGRLGVLMQAFFEMEIVLEVPPEAFDPPPRVDSAVVRLCPLEDPGVADMNMLEQLLSAAFGQRRKMLRGTLLPWLAARGLNDTDLDPQARPQDIEPERYHALANRLSDPDPA
ncbi:MAG: 16S rRNA (adenine(1518)-N(6)/adenine(1519)-N(6))-dimethyltransferase RsmA [Burkholderiaceae bacterium]